MGWIFPGRMLECLTVQTEFKPVGSGKILVVDDNPVIQRTIYYPLRDHGYQVFMAGSIPDAMQAIRKETPDLILLDLSFPVEADNIGGPLRDGFFVIDWIFRTPEIKKVPVVIISETEPAQYQKRAVAAGVRACFQKPLKKEKLLAAVQSLFGK